MSYFSFCGQYNGLRKMLAGLIFYYIFSLINFNQIINTESILCDIIYFDKVIYYL